MRISKEIENKIKGMEDKGYVWLSHLDINAQVRFRNMVKYGFKDFVKVSGVGKNGLTFLTKEVADMLTVAANKGGKRMTAYEQLREYKQRIATLERENKQLKERLGE